MLHRPLREASPGIIRGSVSALGGGVAGLFRGAYRMSMSTRMKDHPAQQCASALTGIAMSIKEVANRTKEVTQALSADPRKATYPLQEAAATPIIRGFIDEHQTPLPHIGGRASFIRKRLHAVLLAMLGTGVGAAPHLTPLAPYLSSSDMSDGSFVSMTADPSPDDDEETILRSLETPEALCAFMEKFVPYKLPESLQEYFSTYRCAPGRSFKMRQGICNNHSRIACDWGEMQQYDGRRIIILRQKDHWQKFISDPLWSRHDIPFSSRFREMFLINHAGHQITELWKEHSETDMSVIIDNATVTYIFGSQTAEEYVAERYPEMEVSLSIRPVRMPDNVVAQMLVYAQKNIPGRQPRGDSVAVASAK